MKRILFVLLAITLAVCGANSTADQTATAEAQTLENMALMDINLEVLPFQPDDLPDSYKIGEASYRYANDLPEPIAPLHVLTQKVGREISSGFKDDYVMIALFQSDDDLARSYSEIVTYFKANESTSATVGQKSAFAMLSASSSEGVFTFMDCKALVVIRIKGAEVNKEFLASYAQKIDGRLSPLVCQP